MLALIIVLVMIGVAVLYAIGVYNGLVTKRNRVKNAWAQIDVQLKRRYDLIPNLVNTVKGYMQYERDVLEHVTRARQQAMAAGSDVAARSAAEATLTQAVRSLFAVAEAYPDLKANQNMLALQEELSSTENRIAFARQHYNDAVFDYNTTIDTLPSHLCAAPLGFQPETLFAVDDTGQQAGPQVQF